MWACVCFFVCVCVGLCYSPGRDPGTDFVNVNVVCVCVCVCVCCVATITGHTDKDDGNNTKNALTIPNHITDTRCPITSQTRKMMLRAMKRGLVPVRQQQMFAKFARMFSAHPLDQLTEAEISKGFLLRYIGIHVDGMIFILMEC